MNGHHSENTLKPNLGENFFEAQNLRVGIEWDMKWAIVFEMFSDNFL